MSYLSEYDDSDNYAGQIDIPNDCTGPFVDSRTKTPYYFNTTTIYKYEGGSVSSYAIPFPADIDRLKAICLNRQGDTIYLLMDKISTYIDSERVYKLKEDFTNFEFVSNAPSNVPTRIYLPSFTVDKNNTIKMVYITGDDIHELRLDLDSLTVNDTVVGGYPDSFNILRGYAVAPDGSSYYIVKSKAKVADRAIEYVSGGVTTRFLNVAYIRSVDAVCDPEGNLVLLYEGNGTPQKIVKINNQGVVLSDSGALEGDWYCLFLDYEGYIYASRYDDTEKSITRWNPDLTNPTVISDRLGSNQINTDPTGYIHKYITGA